MKNIMKLALIIISVFFISSKLEASVLYQEHHDDIWVDTLTVGEYRGFTDKYTDYTIDGKFAYCVEPNVKINSSNYFGEIGYVNSPYSDEINIYEATKVAMKEALNNLSVKPEHVLIDAMKLDLDVPNTSIIKGDAKSESIAAASIIAKVTRDRMLNELDKKFPMYDLKNNKGYGTKKHLEALKKYGPCPHHRKSYAPVRDLISS